MDNIPRSKGFFMNWAKFIKKMMMAVLPFRMSPVRQPIFYSFQFDTKHKKKHTKGSVKSAVIEFLVIVNDRPSVKMVFSLTLSFIKIFSLFIPITRKVKVYTRFVGKYVTGRKKRSRPYKLNIFFIRIIICTSVWTLSSWKL